MDFTLLELAFATGLVCNGFEFIGFEFIGYMYWTDRWIDEQTNRQIRLIDEFNLACLCNGLTCLVIQSQVLLFVSFS